MVSHFFYVRAAKFYLPWSDLSALSTCEDGNDVCAPPEHSLFNKPICTRGFNAQESDNLKYARVFTFPLVSPLRPPFVSLDHPSPDSAPSPRCLSSTLLRGSVRCVLS